MKKLGWALILIIWLVLVIIAHGEEAQERVETRQESAAVQIKDSELYAQAAVLMDAQSGRVLYGKNPDQILAMASTTKIMTCILALEKADLSESVEISGYASGMPKVKLGVRKGETYPLKDLLYSLMLESHNDVAVAIAEHIGKQYLSEEMRQKSAAEFTEAESREAVAAFAGLMNEKAAELDCRNTWFITPNGLDAEETLQQENGEVLQKFHATTATELARIMSYCILGSPKAKEFLQITGAATHSFSANGRSFACYNHNAFLNMMAGAISGKTGFTNRAGYCYVGALEDQGRSFVVALLACGWPYNKTYKWSDTRKLMEYGMENYFYRSFLDEETIFDKKWLEPISVQNGQTNVLGEKAYVQVEVKNVGEGTEKTAEDVENVVGSDDMQLQGLLMKAGEKIQVQYEQEKTLTAPVEEGTVVGSVRYMVEGITYRTEEIITADSVQKITWQWCLEQIWQRFLIGKREVMNEKPLYISCFF